ncbi:hypothetical protein B0919_16330 [Hymenobacter sp. CRA2]|nr:hypothetical protein B0919_16330 [Hymenobacter sp. CRA2]
MPSLWFRGLHRLGQLPALVRLLLAGALAAAAFVGLPGHLPGVTRAVAAWDVFALTSLGLMWVAIVTAEAAHIRAVASSEDPGRTWSFVFVVGAALASLLAVVALLDEVRALARPTLAPYAALSITAVMSAWLLMHTVFTLRYAHLYYAPGPHGDARGLDFPGAGSAPDYLDFAYFSFVIGMTAQTADISISGRALRRVALLHGLISFGFNTAVVALTVSAVAGIL